jgi:YD repeat-containing protein
MSSKTDPNGRTDSFAYDGLNRLIQEVDPNNNVVNEYAYNSVFQGITFQNGALTGNYQRSNCATGYQGSTVTYTVPVGKWTSTLSQCYANAAAASDAATNGPTYANANGVCNPGVYCTNTTSYPFSATMTNVSTGKVYSTSIPAGTNSRIMIYIPAGTYNVKGCQTSGTGNWVFQFGAYSVNGNGATCVTISNAVVNITGDCAIYCNPQGHQQ